MESPVWEEVVVFAASPLLEQARADINTVKARIKNRTLGIMSVFTDEIGSWKAILRRQPGC